MKYDIHDTEALVLKTFPCGEDSLFALLLTRDFGLLYARAQGARKQLSKLRSGLTESSHISVGLLFGKSGWRVTYLIPHKNILFSLGGNLAAKRAVVNIMTVCGRLMNESETDQGIFEAVCRGLLEISENGSRGRELRDRERSIMLRVLYSLGYIELKTYSGFIDIERSLGKDSLPEKVSLQKRMSREINRALRVAC